MRTVLLASLTLALLASPGHAQATQGLTFVSDSPGSIHGKAAVDGDRQTTWLGIARRTPAWIVLKVKAPGSLSGLRVTMTPMAANTWYHVELSEDGRTFERALSNLQNLTGAPELRTFDHPRQANYVRLVFENGSRQAMVSFGLREVEGIAANAARLPGLPSASASVAGATPVASPTPAPPRILGAVVGKWENEKVIVVVGDSFARPVDAVRADDHKLEILGSTPTQILCSFPYPRPARISLRVTVGGKTLARTVSTVSREIRWVPQPTASP